MNMVKEEGSCVAVLGLRREKDHVILQPGFLWTDRWTRLPSEG